MVLGAVIAPRYKINNSSLPRVGCCHALLTLQDSFWFSSCLWQEIFPLISCCRKGAEPRGVPPKTARPCPSSPTQWCVWRLGTPSFSSSASIHRVSVAGAEHVCVSRPAQSSGSTLGILHRSIPSPPAPQICNLGPARALPAGFHFWTGLLWSEIKLVLC